MQPYEIIMSPAELFLALEGEAFPAVDAVPTGNWARLGKAGTRSQSEDGVKVSHSQEIAEHSTAGALGPVKAVRTKEGLAIDLVIEDLTLEAYAKALNGAGIGQIAQAAGVAGAKTMGLSQGIDVTTYSALVRFPSPEGDGMTAQYCIPKVYQKANPSLVFKGDGTAAGLAFQLVALEDPNASSEKERFGYVVEQTLPAT
jgi:hypothetical protein